LTTQDDRSDLLTRFTDRWIPEAMKLDPETCRNARFAVGTAMTPIPAIFLFVPLYWMVTDATSGLLIAVTLFGGIPFYLASLPLIRRFESPMPSVCVALATGTVQLAIVAHLTGGAQAPALAWVIPIPSIALLMGGRRLGLVALVISLSINMFFYATEPAVAQSSRHPVEALIFPSCVLFIFYTMIVFSLYESTKEAAVERLRQLNGRLELARAEAQQANQSKGSFLSRMSHEIRTPLMSILGFTDLLDEEISARRGSRSTDLGGSFEDSLDRVSIDLVRDESEALRTVRRNGEHLLNIIDDLLDLSRIESESIRITRKTVELESFLHEVIDLVSIRAQQRGIELCLEATVPLPSHLDTDATRLRQILVNLLTNAIKFTEVGSVTLRVRLAGNATEPALEFSVEDSGIGMTPEQLRALFKPFTQASRETARLYGGTGLGLAISKRLTEALGGSITAHSEPDVGSTFCLVFPLEDIVSTEQPDLAIAKSLSAEKPATLLGQHILVVDDFPDNRLLLSQILSRAGAKVTLAESGEVALDCVEQAERANAPFSLILMDIQMPGMDGCATTTELRARGCRSVIVALTADALATTRERCMRSGFDAHATKPIQRDRLLALAGETRVSHAAGQGMGGAGTRETPHKPRGLDSRGWCARLVELCVPEAMRSDRAALRRARMVLGFTTVPLPFLGVAAWIFPQVLPAAAAKTLTAVYLGIAPLFLAVVLLLRTTGAISWAGHLTLTYALGMIGATALITGGARSCIGPWLTALPIWALPIIGSRAAAGWLGIVTAMLFGLYGLESAGLSVGNLILTEKQSFAYIVGHTSLLGMLMLLALVYEHEKRDSIERFELLNLELIHAREVADSAREAKERFLATVSHEMRTPMTAILGFSELLQDAWRRHQAPSPESGELLARVEHNGRHLLHLLNDVLDLSKVEAGRLEIEKLPVWPAQVVQELLGPVRAYARTRGVRLRVRIEAQLPETIHADPVRLRQVIQKLLEGAIDSGEKSSLLLRIQTRVLESSTLLVCTIERSATTGRSTRAELEHAWIGTWGSPDGSGGLLAFTLARSLCRELGGTLVLHSDEILGEVIEMSLPIEIIKTSASSMHAAVPVEVGEPRPGAATDCLRGVRMLLAEDSPDSQRLIAHILRQAGALVDIAPDGRSAVECVLGGAATSEPRAAYDLVLMDMHMPILNGAEATARLRSKGFTGPIVALTAASDSDVRSGYERQGCDGFVTKPIDRARLISTLARVLESRRTEAG